MKRISSCWTRWQRRIVWLLLRISIVSVSPMVTQYASKTLLASRTTWDPSCLQDFKTGVSNSLSKMMTAMLLSEDPTGLQLRFVQWLRVSMAQLHRSNWLIGQARSIAIAKWRGYRSLPRSTRERLLWLSSKFSRPLSHRLLTRLTVRSLYSNLTSSGMWSPASASSITLPAILWAWGELWDQLVTACNPARCLSYWTETFHKIDQRFILLSPC